VLYVSDEDLISVHAYAISIAKVSLKSKGQGARGKEFMIIVFTFEIDASFSTVKTYLPSFQIKL